MNSGRRRVLILIALTVIVCITAVLRLMIDRPPGGGVGLAWPDARFARFRWMALASGATAGAALAISGTLLQSMLRNPLASPFILGVSSGAGLGVMIALYIASIGGAAFGGVFETGPAILGALGVLAIVYALGRRERGLDPVSVILVGVVVSTMCGAGMMLFQSLVPTGLRGEFLRWLMGRIPEAPPVDLLIVCVLVTLAGLVISMSKARAMDVAVLPDDVCHAAGVSLSRLRAMQFITAGVLAAMAVTLVGPLGFVGLIAPHAARLALGPAHHVRIIGAVLFGIALVVGSDVARQAIELGHGRLPIGIFTSLIGGPAFLWPVLSGRATS